MTMSILQDDNNNEMKKKLLASFISLHVYLCSFAIQDNASSLLFASRLR